MPITLKAEERDALLSQVSIDLDLLGDLQMAISKGDEEECYLHGRGVVDALRLVVVGGLGWRERTAESTVLTLPDAEISRAVTRLQKDATAAIEQKRPEHDASRAEREELAATKAVCQSILNWVNP